MGASSSSSSSSTTTSSDDAKQQQQHTEDTQDDGEMVRVNVYRPSEGQGPRISVPGFGIYHSGVEVYDTEYVFGGGEFYGSGVWAQRPRVAPKDSPWEFYMTLDVGRTRASRMEVRRVVEEMKAQFKIGSYDITSQNCNHFADALCRRLTDGQHGLPSWVNRAARFGDAVKNVVGQERFDAAAGKPPSSDKNGAAVQGDSYRLAEDVDLFEFMDVDQIACLNEAEPNSAAQLLRQSSSSSSEPAVLRSDADDQLLIYVPFKRPVILTTMFIGAPAAGRRARHAPQSVKLFVNQRSMDFGDAERAINVPSIKFDKDEWRPPSDNAAATHKINKIVLPSVKYQNVSFLTVFVERNMANNDDNDDDDEEEEQEEDSDEDDEDVTIVSTLRFLGRAH